MNGPSNTNPTEIQRTAMILLLMAVEDIRGLEVEHVCAAYEGASAWKGDKVLHVYLCDDDADPVWMLDCANSATGETDPVPCNAKELVKAARWLEAA